MKIVIPGGSGQVGTVLARAFAAGGHDVVVLSRGGKNAHQPWRIVTWDARTVEAAWASELEGASAVINMAGSSVNCRYNAANRKVMVDSRVDSTRTVGAAIAQCSRPPRVWLQASTATIYAHRYDAANDEATGMIGGDEPGAPDTWRFSIDVARRWERAAHEAPTPSTRKVLLRSAMTMSPDPGGVFDTLLGLVRRGLGGRSGDGRQYVSWVHDRDFIRAVNWLIERDDMAGALNICSPLPVPNDEFMRTLRAACGIRFGLPASNWMLEVGAVFLRTETELILKSAQAAKARRQSERNTQRVGRRSESVVRVFIRSRRVVPGRLLESGFGFEFPEWSEAARDLCRRWR